ncbi:Cubilin [Ooceraea biroi]|uniref:Cubilin n=1 Tax=Ooceraea biroi TaxID=2015173 RepID=A0A026WW83_OOCBI|nr:Cubilin [Ooceraea biroi]
MQTPAMPISRISPLRPVFSAGVPREFNKFPIVAGMASAPGWFLLLYLGFCAAWMDERPVLEARDGHLIISSARDRNITLKIMGGGYVNVNEINLLHVASAAQNATRVIDRWQRGYLAVMENSLERLATIVTGPLGLQRRVALLERGIDANGTNRAGNRSRTQNYPIPGFARNSIRRINVRLKALEDTLRAMQTLLRENECQSNPCQNGGTCEDLYDGYQCHCTSNWEGPNCMTDVNECARFLGTDLGCQNRATCRNLPGSYRCDCLPGWFGLHCTQKTSICNAENSGALCGEHGVCVEKSGSSLGYTCICDQGWQKDGTNPACIKDVDECAADHPPCSVNPPVPCRNTLGSFTCGACPHGYSGNGYYCTDIDECLINNGGCSTSPYVQCMNTLGSRVCGACPSGYRGDGISCIYVGGCAINNGGCHPLASCTENPSLTSSYVLCRCPAGYIGNGMGPNGCQIDASVNIACASNPCVYGRCTPTGENGFTCTCNPGYSGTTCNVRVDPCSPNPCRNNGVCQILDGQVTCQCRPSFTGSRCETPRQSCGGVSRNPTGRLQFPMGGSTYQHGLSCAWVLITEPSKVLNVTFSAFNLEHSTDCKFDFLQIHDGRNAGSQMINRFCGDTLPNGNGNIVSSHNTLYLWFHSDSSVSRGGFTFEWNSINPVCGGVLENNYGTISSPGSPGRYPPNRDCFWTINATPSKRIQFHFGLVMLEEHPTCESDYLEITGIDNERLGLFCNHTRPPPLITPSSEAEVHFHSDSAGQDAGFQIHYSLIEGVPGCGGMYTTPTGTISSPGHASSSYQPNMECEWKIQLPMGERIKASWLRFDLEHSSSCQFDFVEIFDGPTTESQLLGRYCGSDIPPTFKSNSNTIVVIFKSDWSYELEGFTLSYEALCGGEFHDSTGILKSPFYPNTYHGSRTCTYEIVQPTNKGIVLTIEDMDIEGREPPDCYYDYLEIYDGDNENTTKLATLCGDVGHIPAEPYYSTHNYMYIKFTTDSSIEGRGFKANYTTIDRRCGGMFKESNHVIQSPIENGVYANNEQCIWTIQAPPGYVIQLTWLSFNLEYHVHCVHDYVNIYENYTASEEDITAKYCGTTKPPDITTQTRTLTILFHTDSSITSDGFVATYIFVDAMKVCGGRYMKSNGVIKSPNYPNYYPNKKECTWIIEAQNKHRIVLTVESFELEDHSSCAFDYLEIRNGGYESAPLIGKFCGTEIPTEIPSQTNQMYIKFVSDFSRSMEGFYIRWDSTTIAAGSLVQLEIVDLDLEQHSKCRFDFIEVFEGISHRTNGRRYCGTTYPTTIQAKSNQMTVRFRSDFSTAGRGFHLKYKTRKKYYFYESECHNKLHGYYGVIESPNFPNKYEHSTNCSWIIEAPIGNTINLTFSHFDLEGSTADITERCQYDYLQINEGDDDTPNTELGRFCGSIDLPKKINSTQHQVFITFITDSYVAFNGFRLEWTVNGCGGHLTKPFDNFTSPQYPFSYPMNVDCEWLIEVDHTYSVELTLHNVETEKAFKGTCHNKLHGYYGVIESPNFPNKYEHSTNCSWIIEAPIGNTINLTFSHFDLEGSTADITERCQYDYLQINEGDDDTPNTELGRFCGSIDLPKKINSTQHQVFITFITDSYVAFNGFRLEWTVNGCGGHLTKPFDNFTSPQYPFSYPMNVDCEWLIEVDHTYSVELTLHNVETEKAFKGTVCPYDKIQIYGGEDSDAPKLVELCYSDKPVIYTSPGNKMFVKFHSDVSYAGRGFNASYRSVPIQCGGRFTANSGVIHSANYPQNYPHIQDCEWLLEVDSNHLVNLTFLDFDIENSRNCTDDYVKVFHILPTVKTHIRTRITNIDFDFVFSQVFDGPTKDDPLLGTHCHNQLPPAYISSSNQMLVVMRTDSIISAKGFKARYTRSCGARIIVKDHGFLTPSSDYISTDTHNPNCTWTLIAEDPADHVTITFTHMEIDPLEISGRLDSYLGPCSLDYVQVFEGEGMDGPLLGKWCDNITPPPVTSTGSSLTVHLYSSNEELLGHFAAAYSVLNTACGGNYTSEKGAITSPGYPNSYPLNAECVWVLNTSPGNRVTLTFSEFDIQSSENCDLDYLEIRENSGIGKLISVSCGKDVASITSSSVLWIKFKSDSSGTAKGFVAEYNYVGGNELEGPSGRITSPLYPKPFRRVAEISWRVTVDMDSIIRVEFSDLHMEKFLTTCVSNVRIFDGYDNEAPVLLDACGYSQPEPVVSSSNVIFIQMKAEYTRQGMFFDLTWLQIPRESSENNKETKLSECNMEVALMSDRNHTYTFSSPGWPTGYAPNVHCNWVFTSPPGTHLVLRIITMNLEESSECIADSVSVYSGYALTSTDNAKLESKLCLSNSSTALIKASNVMTVKFDTDAFVNKTGFNAYVYRDCGGELTGPNGVIEHENSSYTRGIRTWQFTCEWIVTVKPGRTIKVQIIDMSIQETPDHTCGTNSLLLKNGNGMLSPLLGNGKYCGNVLPPELETTGNQLYVKATGNGPYLNFKLTYKEVSMNCGTDFTLTNKQNNWEITTPNYPNIPPTYSECTWKVSAPTGDRISIHFPERFDLSNTKDCEREYVEIRDGGTDGSRLMGRFCKDVAPSTMTTTGNMMYIYFYTDVAEPKNGFKAVITSGEVCGGILRGTSGIIKSPNYPHSYPKNQSCTWLIIGPTEHTLKLEFRDIHLPGFRHCELTDRVEISEKIKLENETISKLGTYCGLRKPDMIETSSNEVYVHFQSDNRDYMSFRGFSINFTASQETCGGSLTALSGIIKSPGYPHPRIRPRYCDWRIVLPMGYQVVVNILDLDIINEFPSTGVGYALTFYNDYRFKSKIKVLGQGSTTQEIKSSSNTMLIAYWSSVGHRGFKLRYSAQIPAPCGGNLREPAGNITGPRSLPFNESSYVCNWKLEPPESMIDLANNTGLTLTIKVSGFLGRTDNAAVQSYNLIHFRTYSPRNCFIPQYIVLQDIGIICRNLTEPAYLRSPKIVNELTMINGTYGKRMDVSLEYQWQSCGGILQGPSHTIKAPKNILYPVNCAWHIDYPAGDTFKLSFTKLQLDLNCDRAFFIIRNGEAMAPQIEKLCGHTAHSGHEINSISNQLWIEYFSSGNSSDFEFKTDIINTGCGGSLHGSNREISSPHFPKQYPNNSECTWEIMGDNGYHIGLAFVDRFSLETSHNCENDYVEVFDWIRKDGDYDNGEWRGLSKVCGRNSPPPFNSTSNRMKVIFHSNEAVRSDGFHAVWSENCGGIFQATERINIIQSPSYPGFYPSNAFCNYTIVAPNEDIIIEFTDFQLERGRSNCRFDNVTVITESLYTHYNMEDTEIYCDNKKPPLLRSLSKVQIIFMTDRYVQRTGFQFKYFINKCGGIITKPSELKPLMHGEEYFGRMNCTWIIKAPQGKSVLVRFEKFILEHSTSCYFDNVAVYEGDFVNPDKRLGLVCGNLTRNLPLFKSDSNSMVVNFNADSSRHFEGFTAKVLFVTSPADGCGETINMTSIQSKSFRTQLAATYQPFEECHWTVVTSPGKNIRLTINSMDIRNSINNTQSDKCTGDYLEVRDGGGLYAEMLGQYCGNVLPLPIVSVSNKLWIRLHTDGTAEGTGATATLDVIECKRISILIIYFTIIIYFSDCDASYDFVTALCGLTNRVINDTVKVLTSPGYPNTYSPGMKCRWTMRHVDEYHSLITARIRFTDFDMEDSNKCENEYVEISEHNEFISEGFGADFIYAGTMKHPVTVELGSRFPYTSYKYCGTQLPHEYYSYSNEFQVTFKSTSSGHKGFKLEYSTANCDRNYTSEQGRIAHHGFTSCWISITVPANRTISLYFVQFNLYDAEHCTHNALQVHDGDSSGPLITTLCNAGIPNPIFSTGNKLTLHSWTESANFYQNYDIIYTTTDAGRGCGGHIFNFGGRFTSPLYPSTYRNNTVCTWDVSVPRGFKIILQFLAFDIGTRRNCENNNVKFYDVVPEQLLRSTYCGGDDPARFEAETNRVLVEYASTVNNVGTGWVIAFMAQSMEHPVDIMDNWT